MTMPGALAHEQHVEAVIRAASVKSHRKLGERLESDVHYFTARDVVRGRGGITFDAGLDFVRKLPGCTPILDRTVLRAGGVARDFVLFDLPTRPGNDLTLIYQPTRWGGAGYVRVPLRCWSSAP
jgi:hypothetical protein